MNEPRAETEYLADLIATQQDIATAQLEPDALMSLIAARTQRLTAADGAVVELAEGDEMVYRAATGSAAAHLGLRLKIDNSLSGRCLRTGETLLCDDSESDPRVNREACRAIGVRSMVVVSLVHQGRAVGVLKVLSLAPNAFRERDVHTLRLLAGLLAAALDQAAQFAANQTLLAERTAGLKELHREREFLKAVLENLGDGVVACDAEGRLTFFNRATRLFHGMLEEPLSAALWAEHYALYRADGVTPLPTEEIPLFRALQGEVVRDAEMVIAPKIGPRRDLLASGQALHGPEGEPLGAVVVMHDVTERREAEAERARLATERVARAHAEAAERRYRTLAEAIPQIVWTARPDGNVEYFNGRWYAYTGLSAEQSRGEGWAAALHPDDQSRSLGLWRDAMTARASFEIEYRLRRALDGSYRWHLGRGIPLLDGEGVVVWFGTSTDIDDQKRAALELATAKEAAESANRAKDEFLDALSHELRTPLTPVLADVSSLMENPSLSAEVRAVLELARRNIKLEALLIDDLLDITRISRGLFQLERAVVDAHMLAHRALELCGAQIAAAKLHLELDLSAEAHHIEADEARIQQVVWNLLRNAVKFTPPGGTITIRSRNVEGPRGKQLELEVIDTGIGIEPELLPRIFNAFQIGVLHGSRRFGGLGLGLAISRTVVETLGGRLTVFSAGKGKGATFTLRIAAVAPAASVTEAPPRRHEPPRETRPLKILLVEDDPSTQRILARLLRSRGREVTTAGSVSEAMEAARPGGFDLIVSDIGLPDGTGWELMQLLRSQGVVRGIALTGFGMEEDVRRSREAGFLAHLTKPIDFQKLEATIHQVAAVESSGNEPSSTPA
ncbi:MAG: hypothetical protein NVSMB9_16590 [Isosphaeraceae bacterium]